MAPPDRKCQFLLNFWLGLHLKPLVGEWSNKLPKAEVMTEHYKIIIVWAKKYKECWNRGLVLNHRELYKVLIIWFDPKDMFHIHTTVWKRIQYKDLDNRLKDVNWLVLHKRLAMRNTLFGHNLTRNKFCPCFGVETAEQNLLL